MFNEILYFMDNFYLNLVYPLIIIFDNTLKILFSPFLGQDRFLMVFSVSFAASIISYVLSIFFNEKNTKNHKIEFKEKIKSLKYLEEINDKKIRHALKKNINENADKIYENILIEKFYNFGITYLFPMFLFLIWLEYSVYPLESEKNLELIFFTANISFGFLLFYNLNLVLIYFIKNFSYYLLVGRKQKFCFNSSKKFNL
ncbi:MAG: hypothetical protein RBR08_01120 [Desulforegulaceae bacterium]|nr:hypothetical protein [Desulforegulaceae bacterium]